MEQDQINIKEIYQRLLVIEEALRKKGIILDKLPEDNEGELTDEFKIELEKRRKSTNYISHVEVKRRILSKK